MRKIIGSILLALGMVLSVASMATASNGGQEHREIVCHKTGSGYIPIPPDKASSHITSEGESERGHTGDFLLKVTYDPKVDGKWNKVKEGFKLLCNGSTPTVTTVTPGPTVTVTETGPATTVTETVEGPTVTENVTVNPTVTETITSTETVTVPVTVTPTVTETVTAVPVTGTVTVTPTVDVTETVGPDVDCPDLTFERAQELLLSDPERYADLDRDGDGVACEANETEVTVTVTPTNTTTVEATPKEVIKTVGSGRVVTKLVDSKARVVAVEQSYEELPYTGINMTYLYLGIIMVLLGTVLLMGRKLMLVRS